MVNEIKPKETIDRHIKLETTNFIFLSGLKNDLLTYGYKSSYTELINMAIEVLNKLFIETHTDKEVRITKLLDILNKRTLINKELKKR